MESKLFRSDPVKSTQTIKQASGTSILEPFQGGRASLIAYGFENRQESQLDPFGGAIK